MEPVSTSPVQPSPAPRPLAQSGPGIRPEFTGTGGELLGRLLVGLILTVITFGIYAPWFMAAFLRYLYSKTTLDRGAAGRVRLEFTGTGGQLLVVGLLGYLLTLVTLGIYLPWFIANLARFFADNSVGTTDDGTRYQLRFEATGGDLFATFFVGGLLSMITLGLYMPWFICKWQQLLASKTSILENGQAAGSIDFIGQGGTLFGTFVVGLILTVVTVGIYLSWFQVKMMKFFSMNTRIKLGNRTYEGDFVGAGVDLFVIHLIGYLLTVVTCGIYMFWYMANQLRFQINNHVYREIPAGG